MESGVGDKPKADDKLSDYIRQFDEYADNSLDERKDAELHRDFYDGKQWTDEEVQTLQNRGQPVITDNKIKDKVEYMEGAERKTRSDPKAFPRTQVHENDADVATDALRYVFDRNRFPQTKSRVFNNLIIEGFGGAEVIVDKKDPQKILIRYVRWDRLYRDPYAMEPDCSDGTYRGILTWMDVDRAKTKWPGKDKVLDSTMSQAPSKSSGETHDDKPRWIDTKRKRVQVFEHFCRHGEKLLRSVFVKGGFLEEPAECPYLDDEGEHDWPLILQSAYIDREGQRYGLVKRYISLQEELNKRRSKSLHLLNTKLVITDTGSVPDINKARAEIHKSDGWVEKNPGTELELHTNLDLSAGHFQLLQQAEAALSVTGPNAALLGQSGAISGKAKELDQQGGALQIGVLFDAIRDWQLRIARSTWNRIRQYWDSEMWIRVTDNEDGVKFVALNQPMVQGDLMAQQLKGQPPEVVQAELQRIAQDPAAREPVTDEAGKQKLRNEVAALDVDIIIDEAPDTIVVQQEEFQKLAELASSGIAIPPDVLIEASQLRNKKQLLDKLKDQPQIPPQIQEQIKQMEEAMTAKQEELQQMEQEIQKAQQALVAQDAKVKQAENGLQTQASDLDVKAAQLEVQAARLDAQEAQLKAAMAQLEAQKTELMAIKMQVESAEAIAKANIDTHAAQAEVKLAGREVEIERNANASAIKEAGMQTDLKLANHKAEMAEKAAKGRTLKVNRGSDGKVSEISES